MGPLPCQCRGTNLPFHRIFLQPHRSHDTVVERHKACDAAVHAPYERPGISEAIEKEHQPMAIEGLAEHEEAVRVVAVHHAHIPIHEALSVVRGAVTSGGVLLGRYEEYVLPVGLLQPGAQVDHGDEQRQEHRRVAQAVHDKFAEQARLSGARLADDEDALEEEVRGHSFIILGNEGLDFGPKEDIPARLIRCTWHWTLEHIGALAGDRVNEGVLGLNIHAITPHFLIVHFCRHPLSAAGMVEIVQVHIPFLRRPLVVLRLGSQLVQRVLAWRLRDDSIDEAAPLAAKRHELGALVVPVGVREEVVARDRICLGVIERVRHHVVDDDAVVPRPLVETAHLHVPQLDPGVDRRDVVGGQSQPRTWRVAVRRVCD
mmetsp:Transcript_88219/g.249995  ORF Transcript_88219/g.249995 Transcript_88219/m.249995 type:complete len:373 (-) Transcript_88219:731-1849(-)